MATRVITTKMAIDGEAEYRASLSRINSELKTLQSALKLTESEFKSNASSIEALTARGDSLKNLYEGQARKVEELQRALENARGASGVYAAEKVSCGPSTGSSAFAGSLRKRRR